MSTVQSPCTKICVIEPITKLCKGCDRTLDEIAEWGMASDPRKQQIIDDIARRRGQMRTAVTK